MNFWLDNDFKNDFSKPINFNKTQKIIILIPFLEKLCMFSFFTRPSFQGIEIYKLNISKRNLKNLVRKILEILQQINFNNAA